MHDEVADREVLKLCKERLQLPRRRRPSLDPLSEDLFFRYYYERFRGEPEACRERACGYVESRAFCLCDINVREGGPQAVAFQKLPCPLGLPPVVGGDI